MELDTHNAALQTELDATKRRHWGALLTLRQRGHPDERRLSYPPIAPSVLT